MPCSNSWALAMDHAALVVLTKGGAETKPETHTVMKAQGSSTTKPPPVKPEAATAYCDAIQLWFRERPAAKELHFLASMAEACRVRSRARHASIPIIAGASTSDSRDLPL